MMAPLSSFHQEQEPNFILESPLPATFLPLPNNNIRPIITNNNILDDDHLIITKPPPPPTNNNNNITTLMRQGDSSSKAAVAQHDDHVTTHMTHKRRKSQQENKGKKQLIKKMKKNEDENNNNNNNNNKKQDSSYIHVRARRGQATDSHSLAERARREKISERMKLLQALVPGCDKVTGKAPMLDEIINYIQSLQYQTEFLSMRLASLSPTYYDFGTDLESLMVRPDQDLSNFPSPVSLPSVEACSPTVAINNYHSDHSLLLQQVQMSDFVLPHGASRQNLWEVDELRHQHVFSPLI